MQIFLFFILAWFNISCSGEKDHEPPVVSISFPPRGNQYSVGDTIIVKATISDNEQIKAVWLTLNKMDGTPLPGNISVTSPPNPYHFEAWFPVTDSSIESDVYEIRLQASDGSNLTNSFTKIYISGIEKQFLFPLVVTRPDENVTLLWKNDTFGWINLVNRQGDYSGSAVSSSFGLVYIAGNINSGVNAYKLPGGEPVFHLPPEIAMYGIGITGIHYSFPLLYTCYYDGYIKGYDHEGKAQYYGTMPDAYHPLHVCKAGSLVVSACHNSGVTRWKLISGYSESGYIIDVMPLDASVDGLLPMQNGDVIVFGTSEGDHKIWRYSPWNGRINFLRETDGLVESFVKIDDENILLSGNNKIYWYKPGINSLVPYRQMTSNCKLAFDIVNDVIYCAVKDSIYVIDFPVPQVLRSLAAPDHIVDIHLIYNKM